jgi:hypothetical protein
MHLESMPGPTFWHQELPKEIDRLLAGVPQNLTLPEDFEVQASIHVPKMRTVLLEMVSNYEADLQGVEVTGVKFVGTEMKGVGRKFNIMHFREQVACVQTVEDVAKVLVKIASFYAPDYGKVGHPCHQWCPVWGKCPDIQRVAITSLIQNFCSSYGAQA